MFNGLETVDLGPDDPAKTLSPATIESLSELFIPPVISDIRIVVESGFKTVDDITEAILNEPASGPLKPELVPIFAELRSKPDALRHHVAGLLGMT